VKREIEAMGIEIISWQQLRDRQTIVAPEPKE